MTPRGCGSLLKVHLLLGLCVVAGGAPTAAPPLLKKSNDAETKDSGPCRGDCERQVVQRLDKWLGSSQGPGARGRGKVAVDAVERGVLSCEALSQAAVRGDDLSFKVLGKNIKGKKVIYEPATSARRAPDNTTPPADDRSPAEAIEVVPVTAGRHAWSGRVKKTDELLNIVWTDDCDSKKFRIYIGLPPTANDGASEFNPTGLMRAIMSVPCDDDEGEADAGCTWLAEVAYAKPLPGAEPSAPRTRTKGPTRKLGSAVPGEGALHMAVASSAAPADAAFAADVELLTQMYNGDGDAHDSFHRAGGRFLHEEGAVVMPSGRRLDNGSDIRVLVVYTAAAESAFGIGLTGTLQIGSAIALQAAENNAVLVNSGLPFKFTTMMQRTTYTEAGTVQAVLNDAANVNGPIPSLAYTRDVYRFDLVQILIGNDGNDGGIGRVGKPDMFTIAGRGFSVVRANRFNDGTFTSVHELGHNMGANHDRATASAKGEVAGWTYGYGFKSCPTDPALQIATVMAYYNFPEGNCARQRLVPYFSSSTMTFNGAPLGSVNENNVAVLQETRVAVANWRISQYSFGDVIDWGPDMLPASIQSKVCPPSMRITSISLRSDLFLIGVLQVTCTNVSTGAIAVLPFAVGGTTGGTVRSATSTTGFYGLHVGDNGYSVSKLTFRKSDFTLTATFGSAGTQSPGGECTGTSDVMIGLRASPSSSGTSVDSIGLICGSVMDFGPDKAPTAITSVVCPPRTFITAITLNSGTLLDRVESITCGKPSTGGFTMILNVNLGGNGGTRRVHTTTFGFNKAEAGSSNGVVSRVRFRGLDTVWSPTFGTQGAGVSTNSCPTGSVFIGIRVSSKFVSPSSFFVDGLGFICSKAAS